MATSKNLKVIFDEYNKSGVIPAGFDEKDLKIALAEMKSGEESNPARKLQAVKGIVSSAVSELNAKYASKLNLDLASRADFTADINAPELNTNTSVIKSDSDKKKVHINLMFNVKKLLNFSPEDLYALVQATIYGIALEKVVSKNKSLFDQQEKQSNDVRLVENVVGAEKDKTDNEKDAGHLKPGLIEYIKDFLKQLLGICPEEIAKSITDKYIDLGIAQNMFDEETLSSVAKPTIQTFKEARRTKLLTNAKNAAETGLKDEADAYSKQATELLSLETREEFNKMKQTGTVTKEFCESYISDFLSSRGIDPNSVIITLGADRYQGAFYDNEKPQRINVDLSKVKSVTDLVMTLSHELTHCSDSNKSKSAGIQNRYGGGLVDSIEWEDLSKAGLSDKNSDEYKLLATLNKYCYHLDTNERHGRIGELSALEFMRKMAGDNSATKKEINKHIKGFIKYQKETVDSAKELQGDDETKNIKGLRSQFESMKSRLPSKAVKMMESRLTFLEQLCEQGLDMSAEQRSIDSVNEIARKLNNQKENEILAEISKQA